jgi:hypothetical protein
MGLPVETLERREVRGKTGGGELKDVLNFAQIPQSVLAKIDELEGRLCRREVPHQLPGGFGQQNLTTGAGGQEPGEAIERGGEVVTVVRCGGAGVQCHTNPDRTEGAPVFSDQRPLRRNRSPHCVERGGKSSLNGITDDLEADTIVGEDRLVENREVALDGGARRRRVLLPTPSATLDVREQEGDSAARKVAHRDRSASPAIISCRLAWGILLAMLTRGTGRVSRP